MFVRFLILVLLGLGAGCGGGGNNAESRDVESTVPDVRVTELKISSPETGATVGSSISFTGTVTSEPATLPPDSIVWTSSRDGVLGTGTTIRPTNLSAGLHTITLTASPRRGTYRTSISVQVTDIAGGSASSVVVSSLDQGRPEAEFRQVELVTSRKGSAGFISGGVEVDGATRDGLKHIAILPEAAGPGVDYLFKREEGMTESGHLDFTRREGMFAYSGDLLPHRKDFGRIVLDIDKALGIVPGVQIVLIPGRGLERVFDKTSIFTMNENTIQELYAAVQAKFEAARPLLETEWRLLTSEERKVAFIMNVVSHLWHFGNFTRVNAAGCVQANELISLSEADLTREDGGDGAPIYWRRARGMNDFLNARIGCCSDFALLLKGLLDQAGLESRRIQVPGHILNEVKIDGNWYVVDASTGVVVDKGMTDMYANSQRKAYVFFTPYMDSTCTDCVAYIYPWFTKFSLSFGFPSNFVTETQYNELPLVETELNQFAGR